VRKTGWFGHILSRKCLLKQAIVGKQERSNRKKRKKTMQLLDDLKETRGHSKLKEEALYHTLRRTRFGR